MMNKKHILCVLIVLFMFLSSNTAYPDAPGPSDNGRRNSNTPKKAPAVERQRNTDVPNSAATVTGLMFDSTSIHSLAASATRDPNTERLHVKLFPVINRTDFQVWESKHYPLSILETKLNEFLASLFLDYPKIDVEILDSSGMNRWLASPGRDGDMAAQLEIYRTLIKTRDNVLGNYDSNAIAMRVKIFDSINAEKFVDRPVNGQDKRYTFAPSEGQLFFLGSMISLPLPFEDGLDLLGLTKSKYKGQKMSYPTWEQFDSTSAWQAFKNAAGAAHRQIMGQVSNTIVRNNGGVETAKAFDPSFSTIGRIISSTANSTRRKREYIISLGEMDSVSVGDVLDVVRSDTYVTVDPERPVVVLPREIGKVKVKWVQEKEAVVVVTHEKSKSDPIQLKDLVIKKYGSIGSR